MSTVETSKASSPRVSKTRNKKKSKSGTSEVVVDISSSPKTSVRSSAKSTRTSKRAADASILSASTSESQPVVRSRKAVKTSDYSAAKKNERSVTFVTAGSSPRHSRRAGRTAKSTANVATELALAAADVDSRKKTLQVTLVNDSVQVSLHVGRKAPGARKRNDTIVVDKSLETSEVGLSGRSTGSSSAKKAAVPVDESKAKANVKTAKAKESHVDSDADKPVAGRRAKPAKSKQLKPVPSKEILDHTTAGFAKSPISTRRGKRQVTVAVEKVKMQQHGQGAAVTSVRRGKRQPVHDEACLLYTSPSPRDS